MDSKRIVIPEHGLEVEVEDEDGCRIEVVNGEPVRVHGASDWDDEDRAAFAEIARAAKEHFRKPVDSGSES